MRITIPVGAVSSPDYTRQKRRDEAYVAAYEQWVAGFSPQQQKELRKLGVEGAQLGRYQYGPGGEAETERPEVSVESETMNRLEPATEIERELGVAFAAALEWACQGQGGLVEVGRRLAVILWVWRRPLIEGLALEIERDLETEFLALVDDGQSGGDGALLGPVLEWTRRGGALSQWGQRFLAMVYVVRPGAINTRTLAEIGAMNHKTRQAVDRLVNDFRDTFGGLKARTMRPERTRIACRNAQLQRT